MVVRDRGHGCGINHPVCKHRWETAKQDGKKDTEKTNANGSQLLVWMAAVNQQLGKSRLQKQSIS